MAKNSNVHKILQNAVQVANHFNNLYCIVDHLFYVLMDEEPIKSFLSTRGINLKNLKSILENYFDNEKYCPKKTGHYTGNPIQTSKTFDRVLARAKLQSIFREQMQEKIDPNKVVSDPEIHPVDLLISIILDRTSYVYQIFDEYNIINPQFENDLNQLAAEAIENEQNPTPQNANPVLQKYCVDLIQQAKNGKITPLIGRVNEVGQLSQVLARKTKNSSILVGPPGVGKSQIVEGLAKRIVEGNIPFNLKNSQIYSLDIGALLAGTRFRGDFEERIKEVLNALEKEPNAILFIDEIHMVHGAGAAGSGAIDMGNLLKPTLARGTLKVIGATTDEDFRKNFEKDRALMRRFIRIDVNEPTLAECKQILHGVRKSFEEFHNVKYTDAALDACVDLSNKYMHNKFLPDKAIDLLDSSGARMKLDESRKEKVIDLLEIENEVSKLAKVPEETVASDDNQVLRDLESHLKTKIFGQNHAVEQLVEGIFIARSGLRENDKTQYAALLAGPSGVGKTQLSKELSQKLNMNFIRFDLSEFQEKHTVSKLIGSPPGYVGYDDGSSNDGGRLLNEIEKNPTSVLLLDEIEKAHPDVLQVLLQVLDYGMLTSSKGKTVSFRNAIILLTTNLGASEMEKNAIGFGAVKKSDVIEEALNKSLAPEFRNRLDAMIVFNKLSQEHILLVVDKFLKELNELISTKNIIIHVTDEVKNWLATKGFDEKLGARPMSRAIHQYIKKPIAREVLFGKLVNGGEVSISLKNNELVFKYHKPKINQILDQLKVVDVAVDIEDTFN